MEERPHKAVLLQQASGFMSEADDWISVEWSDIDRMVVGRLAEMDVTQMDVCYRG